MPFFPRGLLLLVCIVAGGCGQGTGVPPTVVTPPVATPPPAPPPAPQPAPAPPPPVEPAALESLTLAPSNIGSQSTATGTVTLTREAPSEGAVVTLASSVVDAARTPGSVLVPAGSRSTTFAALSPTVGREMTTIISATYLGVTRTATLTVGPPALEADFYFGSSFNTQNRCWITDSAGHLNCRFDAQTSRGFPRAYHWTLQNNDKTIKLTTDKPIIDAPTDCDLLGGSRLNQFNEFTIRVDLQVERDGIRSGNATKTMIVMPFGTGTHGYCGYF